MYDVVHMGIYYGFNIPSRSLEISNGQLMDLGNDRKEAKPVAG